MDSLLLCHPGSPLCNVIYYIYCVHPLQYFGASLVAQLVKNPPAMQETFVQSLGLEDPLEDMATYSSVLAWRIPMNRGAWQAIVHGVTKGKARLSD